ncbi:MAG: SPOR domain-containing protein [Bacteroidales bacterium]|nr:SPOR domain-containing protein [Bacteroidales bacterium]
MKKSIIILALLLAPLFLGAQNSGTSTGNPADTLQAFEPLPDMDASYSGKNIFDLLSASSLTAGTVSIEQSSAMRSAFSRHIARNSSRRITGYRVRIFFDNSQNARQQSESVAGAFAAAYPGISIYRTYVSPYFKVTVGDFRSREEAQLFADRLKGRFPSAFLVKESINYPSLW